MASGAPQSIVRKAGPLERYHVVRSQLGFDSCVVVSARYNAGGVPLDRQTLYPALSSVIRQLGALSVQIVSPRKFKTSPLYVRLPGILFDDVVSFIDQDMADYDGSISRLLEAQIAQAFELGTPIPLWRVTVISGHTLVFKYHHGIGDGQSGMAFHRALLSALNAVRDTAGDVGSKIGIPDSASLVPPVEKMTDCSVPFSTFCRASFHSLLPPSKTKELKVWTGNPVAKTPSEMTNVRCWEISASDTTQLLTLCRHHKATLTTFLHTLLIGIFSGHVADWNAKGESAYKKISSYMPISLRRFSGVSPYEMCVHVSTFHFSTPLAPFPGSDISYTSFPWSTASTMSAKLSSSAGKTRQMVGMARFIFTLGISESYWTGALGKKRQGAFEISNPGRFPPPQEVGDGATTWTISNLYFAQCDAVSGSALKVNVVGSPTGTVNVAFTWGPGALEEALVEAVISELKASLASILTTSTTAGI